MKTCEGAKQKPDTKRSTTEPEKCSCKSTTHRRIQSWSGPGPQAPAAVWVCSHSSTLAGLDWLPQTPHRWTDSQSPLFKRHRHRRTRHMQEKEVRKTCEEDCTRSENKRSETARLPNTFLCSLVPSTRIINGVIVGFVAHVPFASESFSPRLLLPMIPSILCWSSC